ncbi:spore germination protein YaaH [Desulfitispora alkaliphila]|uniref:glycosyl hydrolase family 18 protein n=1 Tax=Desulfitispora alkaliphila TaxID=622674 RepID=UPI003D1A8BA4
METAVPETRRSIKKKNRFKKSSCFVLATFLIIIISFVSLYFYPGLKTIPYYGKEWQVVYGDKLYSNQAIVHKNQVLLGADFIQKYIDPNLYWDEEEEIVIITTADKKVSMATDNLTAYINREPVEINATLEVVESTPFVPINFLKDLYQIELTVDEETKRIVVRDLLEPRALGTVKDSDAILRSTPSVRSPRIDKIATGSTLTILGERQDYYQVQTNNGLVGYIHKNGVHFKGAEIVEYPHPKERAAWKPMGEKINLTWEYVNRRTANPADIAYIPGVNVVSPTWFHLKDSDGNIENNADKAYVKWAHHNGYQVWGLITNKFDRDLTHEVLSSTKKRKKVINQLLVLAELYNLDGINIDFENMHLKDRDLLTQFVREMTPLMHEQGLTVSIDVTIRSTSDNWSRIYDRTALGEIVDYMAVMTYDEHWATSPQAGSVASLPWVERGLVGVLEQVPSEKVLLGIPFYTRVWQEEKQPDGSISVSSRALSMEAAERLIKENGATVTYDENSGQDYAQWTDGNSTYKVWLENEKSISKRVQLANKYDLAGIASWRRGFERKEIWEIIKNELN